MAKLSYNADWSEDDEAEISKLLDLTEEQEERLFTKHKALTITDEQVALLEAMNNESDDDAETGDDAETNDDDTSDDDDDKNDDAQHDRTQHDDADKQDIVDVTVAKSRTRDAVAIGEKLSAEANNILEQGAYAKEKVNVTALRFLNQLRVDLDNETRSAFPIPNSYLKGGKVWIGTGNEARELGTAGNMNYDKFTYNVLNDNNKTVKRASSFCKELFLGTAWGKRLQKDYDDADTGVRSFNPKNGLVLPPQFKGMKRSQVAKRKQLASQRMNFAVNKTREAIKIEQQCYRFDSLKHVGVIFDEETINGVKQVINCNEPIGLYSIRYETVKGKPNTPIPSEPIFYSIGTFTRFDVSKAIEAAGKADDVTMEHILATVKREQGDSGGNKASDKDAWSKTPIVNVRQYENIVSSTVNYLCPDHDGMVSEKTIAAINARRREADGNEFTLMLGDFCVAGDEIWKQIKDDYNKLDAQRTATREAEKLAKQKAAA